jgi:hypothetical protein
MTSKVYIPANTYRHTCAHLAVCQQRAPRCNDCLAEQPKYQHAPVTTWSYEANNFLTRQFCQNLEGSNHEL